MTSRAILRDHLGPALLVVLALLVLLLALWRQPYPPGLDSWGHLFKAEALAQAMRQEGPGAYFTSAWLPQWYMGDPFRTYYPPLTTLTLTPFVYLLGSSFLGLQAFTSLVLVTFASLTYLAVSRLWGKWPAALAAVMALWAPYTLRTLFFEGNLPRVLALLSLPMLVLFTERALTTRGRRMPAIVGLALSWAWAILSHPQQALLFAILFGVYLVARLFLDPDVPLLRAGWWLAGLLAGALLTAPWSLPAYGHGELPNIPYLPVEKVSLFSIGWRAILPAVDVSQGTIIVGFGALALALLAAAARPEPRRTAYALAGLVGIWLSFGPSGVAFSLLPLQQSLLPERFLNISVFMLALSASGLLPFKRRARLARLFVLLGLLFIDFVPSLPLLTRNPDPMSQQRLAEGLASTVDSISRTALFSFPEPTAVEVYYSSGATPIINGWALENTPHHPALRRYLGASRWGPEYLEYLLNLWNVRYAVLRGLPERVDAARAALADMGFRRAERSGDYEIWVDASPTAPVQRIPSQRVLVLGDRSSPLLQAYPFAEEAQVDRLSDLPAGSLARYPAVALMRFEHTTADLARGERRLRDYVERGGRAIFELSGMEDSFGQTVDLLGVHVLRLSFEDELRVRWAPSLAGLPDRLPLSGVAPEGWSGATYDDLDEVLAEVEFGGQWYPILGYKSLGEGQAWFVGLNLLYYAQLTGNQQLIAALREQTLEGVSVSRELGFTPLPVPEWYVDGSRLSFVVDVGPEPAGEALISYTYSPRWRVTVDEQQVPFGSYEHLLKIPLPAGVHIVAIEYRPYGTWWPVAGLAVGLLVALGLLITYFVEGRSFVLLPESKPEEVPESSRSYAPCANCGFRLAEVGPPTAETYPFQVVRCPICGLVMDDEGFQPGRSLNQEERQRALADWLATHGYQAEVVHERWGFAVEDFFIGESETRGLRPPTELGEQADDE